MRLIHLAALLLLSPLAARELSAFDNGLTDLKSPGERAELLAELGYHGLIGRPGNHAQVLKALDQHGLELTATYVVLDATETTCPVPEELVSEIQQLKGRDTRLWLGVNGSSTDEVVVPSLRKVCDLGRELGLEVVLYPHIGFHTDTVAGCLRLHRQAQRKNLGVAFNLCHFLKQNDPGTLEKTLKLAAPHLRMVSIHGADRGDTRNMHWDRLIQPLGEGTFPVGKLLRILDEIGYEGPIGLQCYGIRKPARQHLADSMKAWSGLTASR